MAQKGSKYARKRAVETPVKRHSSLPESDSAVLDVIYDDLTFLDTFEQLDRHEQIQVYMVLKKLSETPVQHASRTDRALIGQALYKLDKINDYAGLKQEEMLRYPLSKDEHHILRMDCYGSIDKRPQHKLSTPYKTMQSQKIAHTLPPESYPLDDQYAAPAWQVFRQFHNFRRIEDRLKAHLSANKADPKMLAVMGVQDFSDLIFHTFSTNKRDIKVSFIEGDSERNGFVKALAEQYADEISDILLNKEHWDERCVKSLLTAMRYAGNTDARKVIITEQIFTDSIIKDLRHHKIDVIGYQSGDPIPEELIDHLADEDKLNLIAARDDAGHLIRGDEFFEVHHKVAISEGGRLPCLAAANYRENYVLVSEGIHRHVLHSFDRFVISDSKQAYRCRLEFKEPKVAFMSGFSQDSQLVIDWTQDSSYKKRLEEDKKYIVSYDDMMLILATNRANSMQKGSKFNLERTVAEVRQNYPTALLLKKLNDKKQKE